MIKLKTEYFIAKRLRKSGSSKGVMQRIASLSVSISIAVMILAISVINGFKSELNSKLELLGSDAIVRPVIEGKALEREQYIEQALRSNHEVKNVCPIAQATGVLTNQNQLEGILLKGITTDYDLAKLEKNLVQGRMPQIGLEQRKKELLISEKLAKKMNLGLEDRQELIFLDDSGEIKKDKYVIKGIYSSGMDQVDNTLLITDIRNIQKLKHWHENQISSYEISSRGRLKTLEFADDIFITLQEAGSSQGLITSDMEQDFPLIFDWLKTHDVNGVIVISIMLIVAIFNMLSSMLIILLERTSTIGLLKSVGMRDGSLQRIFLLRSSHLALKGMLWGNIIGIGLALAQKYSGLIRLDADGYFLTTVPIDLSFAWIVMLNLGAFVIICLSLILPTRVILKIKPDKTLRFK